MREFFRIIITAVVIALVLNSPYAFAQFRLENWKTHSSLLNVISASADSKNRIWAGANGGVFIYDMSEGQVVKIFRNIDALSSLQVTTLRCNTNDQTVYIGSFEGDLDIVTEDFEWTHIGDIKKANYTSPKINDIVFQDSLVYIAGDFGITIFNSKSKVFISTAEKIGSFSINTPVNDLMIDKGKLWAATDKGIASIDINNEISYWKNWKNYIFDVEGAAIQIISYNDSVFTALTRVDMKDYIYKVDADTLSLVLETPDWSDLNALNVAFGKLVYSNQFGIYIHNSSTVYFTQDQDLTGHVPVFINDSLIIGFERYKGIMIFNRDSMIVRVKPNSPASNVFYRMTVDANGNLWTTESRGKLSRLSNENWTNYLYPDFSAMAGVEPFRINVTPDGDALVGTWGKGLMVIEGEKENPAFNFYNSTNSPITCATTSYPDYVVVGDAQEDDFDNVWMINYSENCPGPLLISKTKNNEFFSFNNCLKPDNRSFTLLAIDNNNTKWVGSESGSGVYYFNDNGSLEDKSDDVCGILNKENSLLPGNEIRALVVDKTGVLGVGTSSGLAIVPFTSSVLRNTKISVQLPKINLLKSAVINDVMVDAVNNKWIATENGIWVLSPDWMDSVAYINTKNSPLLSNEVLSLATDESTGKIYIGTRLGLNEVSSLSVLPREAFEIQCYPQPYNPNVDEYMVIEGLAQDAHLRILTLNGELVRALSTTGRKTVWDGLDDRGERVNSGVYVIVASSTSSGATSVGKFAVVKK